MRVASEYACTLFNGGIAVEGGMGAEREQMPSRGTTRCSLQQHNGDERHDAHANSRVSASAWSPQKRMFISRYAVVALVRYCRACSCRSVFRKSLPRSK